jgi:hypothetical protein
LDLERGELNCRAPASPPIRRRKKLVTEAPRRYRTEHQAAPARVVLHKASAFADQEIAGFRAAADD